MMSIRPVSVPEVRTAVSITIDDLAELPIEELTRAYRDGSLDPVDVLTTTLTQIDAVNPTINAIYDLRREEAIAEAEAARQRYREGRSTGPLDGVPVTIKDSIHAVGMRWHHGSAAHGDGVLGTVDAPPTQRLRAAGAIILAKCTMPDYGLSASGVSSFHGIIRNPWGIEFTPGGSSAGAGASLAAGIAMASIGSDIAGSVRLPAAHCGLVALKPTQGMIAHTPASDVRSAGPMARHAVDLALLLRVLGGVHPDDRFSVPVVEDVGLGRGKGSGERLRVGACVDFGFGPPVQDSVRAVFDDAIAALEEDGVLVERIDRAPYDGDAYLPMDDSFRLRGWREYAGSRDPDATPQALVDWFRPAEGWDQARIAQMETDLARGVLQTNALMSRFDALLTPALPVVTFPADRLGPDESMPLRHCTFTAPFNQSGHPAVSLPGGLDDAGLPIGVQLVGHRFSDLGLLALAVRLDAGLRRAVGRPAWPTTPIRLSERTVR